MNTKLRIDPKIRKQQILEVALDLALEVGYQNITRDGLAAKAGVSTGLVSNYFCTMAQLKRAVMRAAVSRENLNVIAQGLGARDPQALKASEEIKQKAVQYLIN